MKSNIFNYFTAAVIGCMTFPVWAGHEDAAELPAITIEGQSERMGTIALQPDSGGALDASALLNRVPGGNVTRNGPLTGLPQYRGLFGNRINVMVDGMSLREVGPNSMDTSLSYIPKTMTRSFNVFDRKYANHLNGINRAVNEDVALFDRFPNPGRNIYATLSYDW